jgi:hypothetical protein
MALHTPSYTPGGVRSVQGFSRDPKLSAGSRAQIRHGISSQHDPSATSAHPRGLHQWDINLRNDTGSLMRDAFIKDTEHDVHDAVSSITSLVSTITDDVDNTGRCP